MPRVPLRRQVLTFLLAAGAFAATLTTPVLPASASAAVAPEAYAFQGAGYGHGVGMSQYGALGMALRGESASEILGFYYGGADTVRAALPTYIRVGMLEARTDGVTVRGTRAPGSSPAAGLVFRTLSRNGSLVARHLPRDTTYSLRPEAGGVSVYDGDGTRRFGPSASGSAIRVDYQNGVDNPSLLHLPQNGRVLRWGYLEVEPVHDGTRARLRAVASMRWQHYLRGIAEIPASWPAETLQAQVIASRSYALGVVQDAGQRRGRERWYGCNCAVRPDTRDQLYRGYEFETAAGADNWQAAVATTDGLVVRYGSQVVKAFYSSSSGGYTASSTVWGGEPIPYYPSKRDPDDAAGGRNPNFRWTVQVPASRVSDALSGLGVGEVTGLRSQEVDASGRVRAALVSGSRGQRSIRGIELRRALKLKSIKFRILPQEA